MPDNAFNSMPTPLMPQSVQILKVELFVRNRLTDIENKLMVSKGESDEAKGER